MAHIIHKIITKTIKYGQHVSDAVLERKYPLLNPYLRKKEIAEGALGVVLMLHRVAEYNRSRLVPNEDLKVSPAFLQKAISKYRKAGFVFLSLDEVYNVINGIKALDKPFVAFTLDDGYLDNYTTAYPVFKRNNVPFCIFVATDFPDKQAILWWYTIEDLILGNNRIALSDGSTYTCITYQQKWDTFRFIREKILKLNQANLLSSLQTLFANYDLNWLEPVQKLSMSWEDVAHLGNEPLCTIGGHTMTHPAFAPLSLEEIKTEIEGGIQKLQSVIDYPIRHFAYPYGSIKEDGQREYEFLKTFNFKTAFISYGGNICQNAKNSMTHLPRFMLKR
ncbi:MAG: polysaccharide deacetylase family protein [Prevotella sp.]|nr:polysaccharide deacetylase family protein [Prevotella sp.]